MRDAEPVNVQNTLLIHVPHQAGYSLVVHLHNKSWPFFAKYPNLGMPSALPVYHLAQGVMATQGYELTMPVGV